MLNSNAKVGSRTPIERETRTSPDLEKAKATDDEMNNLRDNRNSFQNKKDEVISIGDIIASNPEHCRSFTNDSSRLKMQNINENEDTPTLQNIKASNKQDSDETNTSENETYKTWEELFNDIANDYITANYKSLPINFQNESPLEREQALNVHFHTADNHNDPEKVLDTLQPLDGMFDLDGFTEKDPKIVSVDGKDPILESGKLPSLESSIEFEKKRDSGVYFLR